MTNSDKLAWWQTNMVTKTCGYKSYGDTIFIRSKIWINGGKTIQTSQPYWSSIWVNEWLLTQSTLQNLKIIGICNIRRLAVNVENSNMPQLSEITLILPLQFSRLDTQCQKLPHCPARCFVYTKPLYGAFLPPLSDGMKLISVISHLGSNVFLCFA